MIGVDTNVLIRYLVQDDQVQSEIANNFFEKNAGSEASLLLCNIVICEVIWVLERGYKYNKNQITKLLRNIFSTIEFSFEDPEILWLSLEEYEKNSADFSDIVIGNISKKLNCSYTVTFDKDAAKLSDFVQLAPSNKS